MPAPLRRACLAVVALSLCACGGGGGKGASTPADVPSAATVDCHAGAASLEGAFKAPNGSTTVGGARVTISTAAGCVATTGATGQFKFLGVPASTATVTASKGNFTVSVSATPGAVPVQLVVPATSVKLAYVPGAYDSIETILSALGFTPIEIAAADLATANLAQYDAVFLNCGLDESPLDPYYDPSLAASTVSALGAYVSAGGTVYASDWAQSYVEAAWPGKVTFVGRVGQSTDAPVTAQIVDAGLRNAVGGSTAAIQFDLGAWVVIDGAGTGTTVLISGPVTYWGDAGAVTTTKPYAVQFQSGTGRVTYTSFHNEAQATADMQRLLEALVFGL